MLSILTVTLLIGPGSVYHFGDGHSGKHLASCNGVDPVTKRAPCRQCFFPGQHHIAVRAGIAPLGAQGWLCSVKTKRCTWVTVRDSGPFGAKKGKQWQVQIKLKPGWRRRAVVDMTPSVAKAIGHPGWPARVVWLWSKP